MKCSRLSINEIIQDNDVLPWLRFGDDHVPENDLHRCDSRINLLPVLVGDNQSTEGKTVLKVMHRQPENQTFVFVIEMHESGPGLGDITEDCTEARHGRTVPMLRSRDGEESGDVVAFERGKQSFWTERLEELWKVAPEERKSVVDDSGRVFIRWVAHSKVALNCKKNSAPRVTVFLKKSPGILNGTMLASQLMDLCP